MSVVHGFVDPDLVVCRVTDPTHPVRFATPPGESCYTVVYAGKEPIRASRERRILGEYTGHVRAGNTNKQRYFAYLFVPISALVLFEMAPRGALIDAGAVRRAVRWIARYVLR